MVLEQQVDNNFIWFFIPLIFHVFHIARYDTSLFPISIYCITGNGSRGRWTIYWLPGYQKGSILRTSLNLNLLKRFLEYKHSSLKLNSDSRPNIALKIHNEKNNTE